MNHLHIPDGILPVPLWVSGLILMSLALALCVYRLRAMDKMKQVPLLGAVTAVMLVAMNLEIVPLAYHINLSVIAGILLGPALGFVAAFIANLMLALIGHGGITVIGLNTLLLGSEAVLGHTLFTLFRNRLPIFWRAASVTVLSLFITTMFLIAIVAISNVSIELFSHAEEQAVGHEMSFSVPTFAIMTLSLGMIGWIIEAAITGTIVKFIAQVKPDLLGHVLHKRTDETRVRGNRD